MQHIRTFLTENQYNISTYETANRPYMQFSKQHLFITFGTYFIHSLRLEEDQFVLLLQHDEEDKEVRFETEASCIQFLNQLIEHEKKTKELMEQLEEATV